VYWSKTSVSRFETPRASWGSRTSASSSSLTTTGGAPLAERPPPVMAAAAQGRSDAMAQVLLGAARPLGIGQKYEGHGAVLPARSSRMLQ
jgi:hypothetical protein